MSNKMKIAVIAVVFLLAMAGVAFAQSTGNNEQQQRPPFTLGGPYGDGGDYGGGGCCGGW